MNYIRQQRAFRAWRCAHIKELTLRAMAAWYVLFEELNEMHWPEGAVCINKYKLLATYPGSEDTLRRGLEELEELGLLRMEAETAKSHATYELTILYQETEDRAETEQDATQDARKIAADSAGFCDKAAESGDGGGKILTIDRARARTRENVNPNVNPNTNTNSQKAAEAADDRACARGEPPAGGAGDGQKRRAAGVDGEAVAHSREAVQNQGDGGAKNAQDSGVRRAMDAARACGFSMSKRTKEHIARLCGEYGAEWTCGAIERAEIRGRDKCNIGYVQAILSRWSAAGGPDEAGASACENMNKYAQNCAKTGTYAHKTDLCRSYSQRTYTQAEDYALFTDLFADEKALSGEG